MRKGYGLVLVLLMTATRNAVPADWYRSNAAGMIFEGIPSRITALRQKYCLSVEFIAVSALPEPLQAYYQPSYRIELHTLYEEGKESRRQWIFRNEQGKTLVVSSLVFTLEPLTEEEQEEKEIQEPELDALEEEPQEPIPPEPRFTGFIEVYDFFNGNTRLIEEHLFSEEGAETVTAYFYNQQLLIRVETRIKNPVPAEAGEDESTEEAGVQFELLFSDYYRYSRSYALRAVERVYHQELAADSGLTRLQFPHLGLQSAVEEQRKTFVSPSTAYGSEFIQDLSVEAGVQAGYQVVYTTDERGRILTEITQDAEGTVMREIRNTWAGDRLASVDWKTGEEEQRIEYEYDSAGDRILERNYTNGVLERLVRRDQNRETEELYMNGKVILRAIWEDGRKISEERVRP
ncbi:MAG: hypothetical protein LBL76_00665 [Treponema sp.]|nr:hypothetical protein [Treponema sp.]